MTRSGNARASSPTSVRASSTGVALPLPPHSRNSTGRPVGRAPNGNRTTIPPAAPRPGRGGAGGPDRGVALLAPPAKQRVVARALKRRPGGQQPFHDQPGQHQSQRVGRPPGDREETAQRV